MSSPVVIPVDPRQVLLDWLEPLLPTVLPGWRCGWRQDQGFIQGITPGRFIALDVLADIQRSHVLDLYTILFQLWGDNGITDDAERTRAARIVSAHAHRGLNARRNSGPINLPDPFDKDGVRSITQITMTALLRGVDA
jgi:hypothetical protein